MTGSPDDRGGPGGRDERGGHDGDGLGGRDGLWGGDPAGRQHDGGRPDRLERALRPPAEFLSAPPGAFDRIRRRAARRRRTRAALSGAAAVAVLAGSAYLVGSLTADRGDEVVGPPASSARTASAPPPASPPAPTAPAPATTARPQPTRTAPGAPGTAADPATSPPAATPTPTPSRQQSATPMCATSQLSAALGGGDAGAGNLYRYLVLTNHSDSACHLAGYPGLSMLDSAGRQIGAPATRDGRAYDPVVLRPGGSASDTIHTANRMGTCLPTSAELRIYPPGNTAWLDFPGQVTECDGLFSVTPFAAGTTGDPAS